MIAAALSSTSRSPSTLLASCELYHSFSNLISISNLLLNKNHQLTDGVHGDIEYLYTISLQDKILKVYNTRDSDWNEVRRLIKTINFKGEELDEENC